MDWIDKLNARERMRRYRRRLSMLSQGVNIELPLPLPFPLKPEDSWENTETTMNWFLCNQFYAPSSVTKIFRIFQFNRIVTSETAKDYQANKYHQFLRSASCELSMWLSARLSCSSLPVFEWTTVEWSDFAKSVNTGAFVPTNCRQSLDYAKGWAGLVPLYANSGICKMFLLSDQPYEARGLCEYVLWKGVLFGAKLREYRRLKLWKVTQKKTVM